MGKSRVYLSVGSNLGDRLGNIRAAIQRLEPDVHVDAVSSLYETAPVGVEDQPPFYNLVLCGTTSLSPEQLLDSLKTIEAAVGRRKTFRWGPRVVDIDILLYDGRVVDQPALVIPHPEMHRRGFVLIPLAEIAPDVVHPRLGRKISQLRDALDGSGVRQLGPLEMV